MTERQSSGLVRKGKFVRAMLDLMNDGVPRSISELMADGKGSIGPTQDYVQTNLDKLVESKEITLEDGKYFLENPIPRQDEPQEESEAEDVAPAQVQTNAPRPMAAQPKVIVKSGDKFPRNAEFETFLCCAYMTETPGWENGANYYASTHKAKWSIVKFTGSMGGERLNFQDSD